MVIEDYDRAKHFSNGFNVMQEINEKKAKDVKINDEMLELKDLLKKCKGVSEFWDEQMPMMAVEEAGEFIQAIGKMERSTWTDDRKEHLKEEIADMYISLMAIQFHYGIGLVDVYEQMLKKLDIKYDEKGEKV